MAKRAKAFLPHDFKNEVEMCRDYPLVYISRDAYNDMCILVDIVKDEVGWFGMVSRIGDSFFIFKVLLPEQATHAVTCELSPGGISDMAFSIASENEGRDIVEILNSIRFLCHSHCEGSTSPSGQDDKQFRTIMESATDYFIRGICNRKGKLEITLYLIDQGVIIHDCDWNLYDPQAELTRDYWIQEVDSKVSTIVPPIYSGVKGFAGMPDIPGLLNPELVITAIDAPNVNSTKKGIGSKNKALRNKYGDIITMDDYDSIL